jgi:hypothetical protein
MGQEQSSAREGAEDTYCTAGLTTAGQTLCTFDADDFPRHSEQFASDYYQQTSIK